MSLVIYMVARLHKQISVINEDKIFDFFVRSLQLFKYLNIIMTLCFLETAYHHYPFSQRRQQFQ